MDMRKLDTSIFHGVLIGQSTIFDQLYLLLPTRIYFQNHISSLTWGHNDRRIFLATGMYLHVGWVTRKPPSLSHLSRTAIRKCLHELYLVNSLPLPVRLKAQVSCLFSRTIYVSIEFQFQ